MSGVSDDLFNDNDELDLTGWTTEPPSGEIVQEGGDDDGPSVVNDPVLKLDEPDVPLVDDQPDGELALLWGIERDGTRYKTAIVRELNGADEEAISKLNKQAVNYTTNLTDTYLRHAVVSIGPVDIEDEPEVLKELLVIDRDLLFKEIVLVTYGATKEYDNVPCPSCGEDLDIKVDVEGLLEVRNEKPIKSATTNVTLKNGDDVVLRLPTGKDQLVAFQDSKRLPTSAEINTIFIAQCIETVNGEKVRGDKKKWALALTYGDRAKIVSALLDTPELRFKGVEVPCGKCGENLPLVLGWADLLPA